MGDGLILLPGTYWCAVAAYHDGSAILGVYGPYRTRQDAETAAGVLRDAGVYQNESWEILPQRSISTGQDTQPCPADCGADIHDGGCAGQPGSRPAGLLELAEFWAGEAERFQQLAWYQAGNGYPAERRGITGGTGATYARCAAALRQLIGETPAEEPS